jgi:uncharacterized membrane protein
MTRMKFLGAVAYLVILSLPLSASSSELTSCSPSSAAGRIMGTLLDVNDARVARAKVKVEAASFQWEGQSDEAGDFSVEVPAGTYRIYVRATGFRKFESAFLTVKPDVTEMVNIHLEVQPITHPIPVESKKSP